MSVVYLLYVRNGTVCSSLISGGLCSGVLNGYQHCFPLVLPADSTSHLLFIVPHLHSKCHFCISSAAGSVFFQVVAGLPNSQIW